MKATSKQYAQTLYELVKSSSEKELSFLIDKFVKVLIVNNQLSQFDKILKNFNDIWNREEDLIEGEIILAREVDEEALKKIKNFSLKKNKGKKIIFKVSIDEKIKGGFVVRLGDKVFDLSLKEKIVFLKKALNN